jgi:DsbC/DsbD-like thiol-disulfide interchange protein
MVAIPLFGHSENHATSLRVRLRELRGDPTTQKWLVEEPQLVVFQTSPEISSKDADQTLFLQAKIRIRGKFYASTFELISLP